jgi:hypothetical protein
MMIASPATTPDQSTTAPISVREFDEIVLNIQLIDNFGDTTAWGALSGHSFAQELKVKVLYSNMVDFVEMPPTLGSFPTSSTHWSSLLLEDVAVPFTGTVEVAEYAITIKNIQIGATGYFADGVTPSMGGLSSPTHVERSINLRIPTTMAEWVAFVVDVDTSGGGFPDVWTTSPVVDFSVYRGLAL